MTLLSRIPGDIRAGLRACLDLLLWGHVYPSRYPTGASAPDIAEES
ncbi:hypothetical protein [Actinacidiphila sp. ITFR-21]|nr:hypothetical protein [Streptomyces sp. ITFR-21]WNI19231.1 hypothetical protein RLT57_29250 [Streptomyces sp. ITFR-21]